MNGTLRLARAEIRKLRTTRAVPVSFAAAIGLAVVSVVIDALVAGKHGAPRLGSTAADYQMLKFGSVPCVVMLIVGILAAGGEFRHRTIIPAVLAAPHRGRVFAVKALVIAVTGALFGAVTFGLGLAAMAVTLSAHGAGQLPPATDRLYLGTVVATACFGMIGVALGALTRNTVGAIIAAIAWTLFVEQIILQTVLPGIEKWLPTSAAIDLTNVPGPGHTLAPVTASLLLAGYALALLLVSVRTTIPRDIT